MNYNLLRLIIITLSLLNINVAFSQGLYWESKTTINMNGAKETTYNSCYRPKMFKQWSEQEATIFLLDKELIYSINHERKEYSEMTFIELENMAKHASGVLEAQMGELKKHLDNLPPEQRKMMEQMMSDKIKDESSDVKIEVIKTTESKTISGYPCTKYQIKEGGKGFGSIWTTTNIPDFTSMRDDFKAFSQRIASLTTMRGTQMSTAMKKIDGFPIQSSFAGITIIVTKIEKKSIPLSEFEIPAGYKKVESKSLMDKKSKQN